MIIDNKAHARKGKSLVEFSVKKYFSNLAENSKFTFYCQNQFFALYHLRWPIKLHNSSMSNKAEPSNLIQIFPVTTPAPVTVRPAFPYPH